MPRVTISGDNGFKVYMEMEPDPPVQPEQPQRRAVKVSRRSNSRKKLNKPVIEQLAMDL